MVGRGIALLFHDRSTGRWWVVSSTPRPHFTPGKTRYPLYKGLGGPQGRFGRAENLVPKRDSIPDHQARSQSLYRLNYPAYEMKLLRPLAGYTLYDHKTNDYIRRELRVTGILDKIDEYRRSWLSHLQRMPQNLIRLKSYLYRSQGRRTIGRPKKRWREQL